MSKQSVETGKGNRTSEVASAIDGVGLAVGSMGQALRDLSEVMEKVVLKLESISDSIAGLEFSRPSSTTAMTRRSSVAPRLAPPPNARQPVVGGPRKASISKGVDQLISSGWLVGKSQDEIVAKLQERFPGANADNVLHVLKRRLNRTLVRVSVGKGWKWSIVETK